MNKRIKFLVLFLVVVGLTACASNRGKSGLLLITPPTLVGITVTDSGSCDIETQTVSQSCNFIGNQDPSDVACQLPSINNPPTKMIEWTAASGTGNFAIVFDNSEDPFVNTSSNNCRISVANSTFTCVIREDTRTRPLKSHYKYTVVFSDTCQLDPRIYLVR